ncbi:MAG: hypothetical protein HYX68_21370 [Planctomycetes bacterium]|nr:hypothetical protein [Planctomycetota bacterium]
MRQPGHVLAGWALLVSLTCVSSADAQLLWRWFGPKAAEKKSLPKSSQPDTRRITEIGVEIAWLADPMTFPYYLEARVSGSRLEVHGYVPNQAVREQALRIAQVYSSLPVADAMKQHPSLTVKTTQMSAEQLHRAALSALRVALPRQAGQLRVECGADGKVFVLGAVKTHEEKMAVSNSLRRLHGCTSVQNLAVFSASPGGSGAPAVINTSNLPAGSPDRPVVARDNKSKPWLRWPWSKSNASTRDEPPLLEPRGQSPAVVEASRPRIGDGPSLIPNVTTSKPPEATNEPPIAKADSSTVTVGQLQKRIKAAWSQARSVDVQFAANREVRITIVVRAEREISAAAERILALPELQNYRPELQFKIASQ